MLYLATCCLGMKWTYACIHLFQCEDTTLLTWNIINFSFSIIIIIIIIIIFIIIIINIIIISPSVLPGAPRPRFHVGYGHL